MRSAAAERDGCKSEREIECFIKGAKWAEDCPPTWEIARRDAKKRRTDRRVARKDAYLVLNTLLGDDDDVYVIPATATHIWVEAEYRYANIVFNIYADLAYRETIPMHCGGFIMDIGKVVGHEWFMENGMDIDYALLVTMDDRRDLSEMIARQIADCGEVDCNVLSEYAERVIAPALKSRLEDEMANELQF